MPDKQKDCVVVPREPTEEMLNAARDWALKKYGMGVGDDAARGCYEAMLSASPSHPQEKDAGRWMILSIGHMREFALWWKPDGRGYTTDLRKAGRYTEAEAKRVEASAIGKDRAISPETVEQFDARLVVPVEENFAALTGHANRTKLDAAIDRAIKETGER